MVEGKIKLTKTMLEKSIIDANGSVRQLSKELLDIDYAKMKCGEKHKVDAVIWLFDAMSNTEIKSEVRFYRANNARGDRRISIKNIRKHFKAGDTLILKVKDDVLVVDCDSYR
jgi:hypothetical protein